jgi:hypothetical protein
MGVLGGTHTGHIWDRMGQFIVSPSITEAVDTAPRKKFFTNTVY